MAHIHLEDGSFTLFWAAAWWLVALLLIAAALFWVRSVKKIDNRTITLAAFCSAAAFTVFQISIPVMGGRTPEPYSPYRNTGWPGNRFFCGADHQHSFRVCGSRGLGDDWSKHAG